MGIFNGSKNSKIRVGIIANEFLDPGIGRLGGFGWAASKAARVLNNHSDGFFDAVYLSGEIHRNNCTVTSSNGIRLILNSGNWYKDVLNHHREKIDILLSIDYRVSYNNAINALPRIPLIVWVRDPHTPEDHEKRRSLRIPGREDEIPPGLPKINSTLVARFTGMNPLYRRKVFLANKMPHLTAKNEATYGLPPSDIVLPNPDIIDYKKYNGHFEKKNRVVFLGRLDPIKRPWLFIELAQNFPETEFIMMGNNHFKDKGGWNPENIPDNLKMPGHVSGDEKIRILCSAKVLVNTSIHEESPVSVFEALACETPVLSYEDWGDVVQKHGIVIGQHSGSGVDGLSALSDGLRQLLEKPELSARLGKSGRKYVQSEHNNERFLDSFSSVCKMAGLIKDPESRKVAV